MKNKLDIDADYFQTVQETYICQKNVQKPQVGSEIKAGQVNLSSDTKGAQKTNRIIKSFGQTIDVSENC